jgi:hypothetical protein
MNLQSVNLMNDLMIWVIVIQNGKNDLNENQKKDEYFLMMGVTDMAI